MRITVYGRGPVVPSNTRFTGTTHNAGERGFARMHNRTVVQNDGLKEVTVVRRPVPAKEPAT
jgi:hypothetical protein